MSDITEYQNMIRSNIINRERTLHAERWGDKSRIHRALKGLIPLRERTLRQARNDRLKAVDNDDMNKQFEILLNTDANACKELDRIADLYIETGEV